jgi:hypothetical protein
VLVLFAVMTAACNWPMVGFDTAHTNYNPWEQRINVANVGSLRPSWTAPLASGIAQPVVADGIVYASNNDSPFVVAAFDARGVDPCAAIREPARRFGPVRSSVARSCSRSSRGRCTSVPPAV